MSFDPVTNFAKVQVSIGYDASTTSVALSSGEGAKLPNPATSGAFNLIWYNSTDYSDPTDDPNKEIVRCTARSTDTLTITRAQEGTSATTKNTSNKIYKMILGFTKKTYDDFSVAFVIPYIQLSSTANQVPANTAETLITYTTVDEQQTFAFTPTSGTITIPESGVYVLIAGGQVGKTSGATNRLLDLWIKKNGVDVPRSSVRNSVKDSGDTKVVIVNAAIRLNANDTIKIYVVVDDTTGNVGLYATTPAVGPVIPSIILTLYKISQ